MIRRPLLYMAAALAAAIIILYYMGFLMSVVTLILMIPAFEIMNKRRLGLIVITGFALGIASMTIWEQVPDDMVRAVEEGNVSLCAEVEASSIKETQGGEEYLSMVVAPKMINGRRVNASRRTLINCYEGSYREYILPGTYIEAYGSVALPRVKRNPGCFDYRRYLKSQNVTTIITGKSVRVIPGRGSAIKQSLFSVRESYIKSVEQAAGSETAGMLKAIMFGDKGGLDDETLEVFRKNGTAHILAVSGLHIGIIYAFLLKIWGLIGIRKNWYFFLFCGLFFSSYIVLACYSPSVIRAVVMVMLHTFAELTNRKYDINSAAFLVTIMVLVRNPYMLFNAGFQMSFLAVLTMILVAPYIRKFYEGALLSGLAIQLGLGPYVLYNFNYISLLAVLVNVPVIALTGIAVPLGLINIPLSFVGVKAIAKALGVLCFFLTWLNDMTAVDGKTVFLVGSPPLFLIISYYLGLLILASEEGRRMIIRLRDVRYILGLVLLVLIISFSASKFIDDGFRNCDVTFVDVGQGDCMHIKTGGKNFLVDGGGSMDHNIGEDTLKPYLLKSGVSHVDGAFATHMHTDHYRGICELAREGMVERLYVYEGCRVMEDKIINDTGLSRENIIYLNSGQVLSLGRKLRIEVLWPASKPDAEYRRLAENEDEENDSSLVLKINFGKSSLIATGDIDENGEKRVMEEARRIGLSLDADVLKLAHHGSIYSSSDEFIEAVTPIMAIAQVGKNNYGHPSEKLLKSLENTGVRTYRNDVNGAVGITFDGGRIKSLVTLIH